MVGALVVGHEGHDALVRPTYKDVQVDSAVYRVGFAVIPQNPVVGEDVRLEFRVLRSMAETAGSRIETPLIADSTQVEIIPTAGPPVQAARIAPGDKPGAYVVRQRFTASGQYGISTRARTASATIATEFPVLVSPGPVERAPIVVDAVVVLVLGALAFTAWRARRDGPTGWTGRDAALLVAGAGILVAAHIWIAPRIGRLFLPERHGGIVQWENTAPREGAPATEPEEAPHTHPPGTPPHSHQPKPAGGRGPAGQVPPDESPPRDVREVASTVVPVPGQLADVFVPVTARVLFEGFVPRLGRTVRKGQTLAVLEQHYILHDANHLINERWPYLLNTLATRRATFDLELKVSRLRRAQETGDAAVRQMMGLTQTVAEAEADLAVARMKQQQAEKALAAHDAQITSTNLVRRPVKSPLDGTIDEVHFTQGQLKYENDKLLSIVDLSRVWIEARFPESAASRPVPARMTFVSPAFPDLRFEGTLERVADALDANTRTLPAFFLVANPQRLLRIGMRLAGRGPGAGAPAGAVAAVPDPNVVRAADRTVPALTIAATVKAQPERTAEVTAPLWGRIEFAGRRLNVGDRVRKGENLARIVLELSVDERYPMEARAAEINAERDVAGTRLERAAKQYEQAVVALKANPSDKFLKEEVELTERRHRAAQLENVLLTRQADVFQGVMKRRDPRITIVQAPLSGVITELGFRPGELNRTGEFRRLMTIVDPSRVWLEAQVYEHQSAAIVRATRASFRSPGLASPRLLDRPIAVSGSLNPAVGTLSVVYDVPNPDGALKVGASAQIVIPRN